jgi:hypothetical protein
MLAHRQEATIKLSRSEVEAILLYATELQSDDINSKMFDKETRAAAVSIFQKLSAQIDGVDDE